MANFEGFTAKIFPGNDEFDSRETGMGLFPGFPGTGTGMDALDIGFDEKTTKN